MNGLDNVEDPARASIDFALQFTRGAFLTPSDRAFRAAVFILEYSCLSTILGLSKPLLDALAAKNYSQATPIQTQAIPTVLSGRDLLGIAQTGTGKTAAFMLPSLDRLAANRNIPKPGQIRMLVLAPTRELASQIAASAETYGRFMRLSVGVIFGGVPNSKSVRTVSRGLDVLVATPGRLLDLIDQRALSLRELEILVLDEADQMLDLGFIHALKRIVSLIPAKRQTLFFSATMPKAIKELADRYLTNPAEVAVTPVAKTADRVEQKVVMVNQPEKTALLTMFLRSEEQIERTLVFSRTKHGADKIVRMLGAAGIRGQRHPRQQEPGAARAGARRVPFRPDAGADRDRHRRARDRYPGRQPRHQLRPAGSARAICPPHRPHRARRRRRARRSRSARTTSGACFAISNG